MHTEEIPEWLTKEFLENSLNGVDSSNVTVVEFKVERAIAKGNNYVCDILRVPVEYTTSTECDIQKTSLMMKVPRAGGLCKYIMKMGLVDKEVSVYNEFFPHIRRINSKDDYLAKSYRSSQENVIILDDLNFHGYTIVRDRQKGLDYDHCVVALKAMARFHAASVKCHEDNPEIVERIGREIIYSDSKTRLNKMFVTIHFQIVYEEVTKFPELSKYFDKISFYNTNFWELMKDMMTPKKTNFNVFNHGDFWTPNLMFKYENNKPTDVKLLDFQQSRYNSPAVDLTFFFEGSVHEDLRTSKREEFLSVYLTELNSTLELLDCQKRLPKEELEDALRQFDFHALVANFFLLPVVLAEDEKAADLAEISALDARVDLTNPIRKSFQSNAYRKLLSKRLEEYEEKGWF